LGKFIRKGKGSGADSIRIRFLTLSPFGGILNLAGTMAVCNCNISGNSATSHIVRNPSTCVESPKRGKGRRLLLHKNSDTAGFCLTEEGRGEWNGCGFSAPRAMIR
jgi:hypothetical protein